MHNANGLRSTDRPLPWNLVMTTMLIGYIIGTALWLLGLDHKAIQILTAIPGFENFPETARWMRPVTFAVLSAVSVFCIWLLAVAVRDLTVKLLQR